MTHPLAQERLALAKGLSLLPLPPADKTWLDTELCQRELNRGIPVVVYSCDPDGSK